MSLDKKGSITPHKHLRDESDDLKRDQYLSFQPHFSKPSGNSKINKKDARHDWHTKHQAHSKILYQPSRESSAETLHFSNKAHFQSKARLGTRVNENCAENHFHKTQSKSREPQISGLPNPKMFVEGTTIKPFGSKGNETQNQHKFSLLRVQRQGKMGSLHVNRDNISRNSQATVDTPSQRIISIPEESALESRLTIDKFGFMLKDPLPKTSEINQIVNNIIATSKHNYDRKCEPEIISQKRVQKKIQEIKDSPLPREHPDEKTSNDFCRDSTTLQTRQIVPKFKIKSMMRTPSKRPNYSSENLPACIDEECEVRPFVPNLENSELASFQTTYSSFVKSITSYLSGLPADITDNCNSDLAKLFSEIDDLRYFVLQCKNNPWKGPDTPEVSSAGIHGLGLYAYDFKNFKSHRVVIHHLSAISVSSQLIMLQKLEQSIFSSQERPIDEVFFKVRHKKGLNGEYESISKEVIDRLKPLGWKWKMVLNELDARYTVFWKKRDSDTYGQANDVCQESFKTIFTGFLSNDPNLVFLNKRDGYAESVLCSELMDFFTRAFQEKLSPTEKNSTSRIITSSSILIKSQIDDMSVLNRPDRPRSDLSAPQSSNDCVSQNDRHTPKEKKSLGEESCRNKIAINVNNDPTPKEETANLMDEAMLFEYTDIKQVDNAPHLISEIESIFKSKMRDKHLKKLHFQTQNRFLSILATFRLAVRLPQLAVRNEMINGRTVRLIRLPFFSKIEESFGSNPAFLVNTLDPNFKLFVAKSDLGITDDILRLHTKDLEGKLNSLEEEPLESAGFVWVPQFMKSSIFDFFGQQNDIKSFFKFELTLSHEIGANSILCNPRPTDMRIKNDYFLGIVKLNSEQNHLSLLATFKIAKANFI